MPLCDSNLQRTRQGLREAADGPGSGRRTRAQHRCHARLFAHTAALAEAPFPALQSLQPPQPATATLTTIDLPSLQLLCKLQAAGTATLEERKPWAKRLRSSPNQNQICLRTGVFQVFRCVYHASLSSEATLTTSADLSQSWIWRR
jgi:hypothetical protein